MVVLVTVLGDLTVVVADNDLFNDFSFSGELADFSTTEVDRRADVFVANGDLSVEVADVPLTFDFIVRVDGFGGALNAKLSN